MNFIYKSFNLTFFLVFAVSFLVYKLLLGISKKRGPEFSKKLLIVITSLSFLLFFVYKIDLSHDAEYVTIEDIINTGGFQWGAELPLNLCNINLWLLPIALLTDKRVLKSFCFFTGPLGTICAIAMPCPGFVDYSIFVPRVFFYLLLHYVGFWTTIALYTTGLYRPTKKDIVPAVLCIMAVSFAIHIINNIILVTGFADYPNFMFTMFPSPGNPILEALFKLIPVKYVYLLPLILVLGVYMFGIIALMDFADSKKNIEEEVQIQAE